MTNWNPAAVLYNTSGSAVGTSNNPLFVSGNVGIQNFPTVQTVAGSVSVYTQGPQNISGTVTVTSTGSLPVLVVGTPQVTGTVALTGRLTTNVYTSGLQGISGSVTVSNFPTIQTVAGAVSTYTQGAQAISGTVSVANLPAIQTVAGAVSTYTQGAQLISGTVAVSNFPAIQTVGGSVATYTQGPQSISGTVTVTSTGSLPVFVTNVPTITGTVGLTGRLVTEVYTSNLQGISGTVGISSLPLIGGSVSTYTQGAQLVSGTVTVTSTGSLPVVFSGTAQVTGTVTVNNFPATQRVVGSISTYTDGAQLISGTLAVSNFPSVQTVGGSVATYTQGAQLVSGNVVITSTGSLPVVFSGVSQVTGAVTVNNFPATQRIIGGVSVYTDGLQGISGAVTVTNFPSIQTVVGSVATYTQGPQNISGTVNITSTGSLPVVITNVSQVTGTVGITGPIVASVYTEGPQLVSGSVTVSNFPAVQPVSFPGGVSVYTQGTQNVSGSVSVYTQGAQLVSGTVTVQTANNIALRVWDSGTQRVTGSISTFTQGAQQVSGSVSVYTQGAQLISGTVTVTSTGSFPVRVTAGPNVSTIDNQGNILGVLDRTFYSDPNGDRRNVLVNATITANSSSVFSGMGHSGWYLIANASGTPTGVSPTLQFLVEQVDPIDRATVLGSTRNFIGSTLTASGSSVILIPELFSDTIKVSWRVGGTTPSWPGVNVTLCGHGPGNAIEGQNVTGSIVTDNPVGIAGIDASNRVQFLRVDSAGNLNVINNSISSVATASIASGHLTYGSQAGARTAVRATTYNEPTSNAQRSINSSNGSDTLLGTGARQVRITYYDSSLNGPFTETLNLNGGSFVNTVATNICYIESMEVTQVGSTGWNLGTITLYGSTGGGGGTIGSIGFGNLVSSVGDNKTLWAHHYVRNTLTCSVAGFTCGHYGSQTAMSMLMSQKLIANAPEIILSDITAAGANSNSVIRVFNSPIIVLGPARIALYVISNITNTRFFGGFDYFEQQV